MLKHLFESGSAKKLFQILKNAGATSRFIGGCVRNSILGIPVTDIDIATTMLPSETEKVLQSHGIKTFSVGKVFGTIIAVIEGHSYEITTLRQDVDFYDGRHAVVKYTNDWRVDAERRDFTFNAMSYCPYQDKVFDYFNGYQDLSNGVVQFIGDADSRVKEDYLRILRFFRFYAYYGKSFAEDSLQACIKNISGLKLISVERKWQELKKIFSSHNLAVLELMISNGILSGVLNTDVSIDTIEKLKATFSLEEEFNHNKNILFTLFVIMYTNNIKVGYVKKHLSLSNQDVSYLSKLSDCFNEIKIKGIKNQLHYYIYTWKEILLDGLLLLFILYDNQDKNLFEDIKYIIVNSEMSFPVTGYDIIKEFNIKGSDKKIGELLKIGIHYWCGHQFNKNKHQIIKYIRKHEQ